MALSTLTQDETNTQTADEIADEVTAEELDISEPGRFGWLKRFGRNVRIVFTRDALKKSELELKNAAEDLYKAKILTNKNPDDPKLQAKIEKLNNKYQKNIQRINSRLEKFKQEHPDDERLSKFLDKYTSHQLKHMEILKRLEEQVPEKVMQMIRQKKQLHLERFEQNMNRLQDKEQFKNRLNQMFEDKDSGEKRQIRRMEILEELEQVSPEAKERAQEIKQERRQLFQQLKNERQQIKLDQKNLKEN